MGYSPSTIPHFRRSPEYLSPKNSAVLSSGTSNANCRTIIIYSFLKNNRDFLTLSPQISKNFWNLSSFETFFNLYFAKGQKKTPFHTEKASFGLDYSPFRFRISSFMRSNTDSYRVDRIFGNALSRRRRKKRFLPDAS